LKKSKVKVPTNEVINKFNCLWRVFPPKIRAKVLQGIWPEHFKTNPRSKLRMKGRTWGKVSSSLLRAGRSFTIKRWVRRCRLRYQDSNVDGDDFPVDEETPLPTHPVK